MKKKKTIQTSDQSQARQRARTSTLQNPLITQDKDGAQWEIARKSHATILNEISDYLVFGFILIRI